MKVNYRVRHVLCSLVVLAAVGCPRLVLADAQENFKKGAAAYVNHDLPSAERYFRAAVSENPDLLGARLFLGHSLFYQEKYKEAVPEYEKVAELDGKTHQLKRDEKRLLTDQLGMAYGLSGQLEKAKTTFEQGIKDDPDYPLFYYNLACAYAELGNLDNAIANLKLGYARRANMLGDEKYPNPRQDDSFKRYLGNAKFERAMKEMGFED